MSLIALFYQHLFVSALEERRSVPGRNELPFLLRYGVPQRSCLGPLLFTIYASKLFEILKRHLLDVHVYADDKQLYLLFKPGSNVSELEAVTALQNCIIDIKTWMTTDKLKLNDGKTEFIIIGTRAQLDKINITKLSIDQVKVSAVAA